MQKKTRSTLACCVRRCGFDDTVPHIAPFTHSVMAISDHSVEWAHVADWQYTPILFKIKGFEQSGLSVGVCGYELIDVHYLPRSSLASIESNL